MSKYHHYAVRVDSIAREAFEAYDRAEKAYKQAREVAAATPLHSVMDAAYAAQAARVQADHLEAKEAFEAAQQAVRAREADVKAQCRELAAQVEVDYAVDPAQLDTVTMELLKSGILTHQDYDKLARQAQDADNVTMLRLIGKHARDAAEAVAARDGESAPEAALLREVAHRCRQNPGDSNTEGLEALARVYERCVANPGMMAHWDQLTGEAVANF